jgi:hypothetical protein
MASAASPSPAVTKMMSNTYPMAHADSWHACGEDGHLKRPHPRIIDGDNRVAGWLVVAWTWFCDIWHVIYLATGGKNCSLAKTACGSTNSYVAYEAGKTCTPRMNLDESWWPLQFWPSWVISLTEGWATTSRRASTGFLAGKNLNF